MEKEKTITISPDLYDLILKRIKNSNGEFKTVDEYVDYILTEILMDKSQSYTKEEKEEIAKNLKDLGYL